jgi:hypothetical protein
MIFFQEFSKGDPCTMGNRMENSIKFIVWMYKHIIFATYWLWTGKFRLRLHSCFYIYNTGDITSTQQACCEEKMRQYVQNIQMNWGSYNIFCMLPLPERSFMKNLFHDTQFGTNELNNMRQIFYFSTLDFINQHSRGIF